MYHNAPRNVETENYEVVVGHARVRVQGRSQTDAVEKARNRLCIDNPRLWDVIQALEIKCFEIRRVE